jgi:hypothetical protein
MLTVGMRCLFLWALAVGVLGLSGCATPLNVQKSGASAAASVGVPSSQIKFIGYCGFGDVPPGGNHVESNGGQGLIILTGDSLVLLAGDLPNATVRQRIKYQDIGGVDVRHFGRARQLQILKGNVVVVMEITKNKAMIDQAGTDRAAEILRQHGVPQWQGKKYYLPKRKIPIIIPVPI